MRRLSTHRSLSLQAKPGDPPIHPPTVVQVGVGGSWEGAGGGLRRAEERTRKGWGVENGDAVLPHTAQAPALLWHPCHCWLRVGPLHPSLSVARVKINTEVP